MKIRLFTFGLILAVLTSCTTQNAVSEAADKVAALAEITAFQAELKDHWENPETTPLHEEEKESFQGIHFFPIDLNYTVNAKFKPMKNGRTLPFPTSANKIKHYKEYGTAHFKLNGKNHVLTIYASDPPIEGYETSLFLPFMDDTNAETTYGGGRYLDFEISDIQNGRLIIDFNQAYNPYCAYSNHYNCPIPPVNNFIETEVKAGVSYKQ